MAEPEASTGLLARLRNPFARRRPPEPTTYGRLVYAIGDIHGCHGLLAELLGKVQEDHRQRGQGRRPVLVFCGDYVDRGPDSAKVVETVFDFTKRSDFDVRALKGNHEQAMLAFIDDPRSGWTWLKYCGTETLLSYGVAPPVDEDSDPLRAAAELVAALPPQHLQFLRRLELMVSIGDYAFVHAGVRPGQPLHRQTEKDLLWIRDGFLDHDKPLEKVIIHGHTWIDHEPQIKRGRIGIDTGAYSTGVLTALRLDGVEREFLHAGLKPGA